MIRGGRSPHGERGLKSHRHNREASRRRSLPPRGAWIEIFGWFRVFRATARRSPHGERGLKFVLDNLNAGANVSLPPRGAWIEIAANGTPERPA